MVEAVRCNPRDNVPSVQRQGSFDEVAGLCHGMSNSVLLGEATAKFLLAFVEGSHLGDVSQGGFKGRRTAFASEDPDGHTGRQRRAGKIDSREDGFLREAVTGLRT